MAEFGLELAIVPLPTPHSAKMLEPIAKAFAQLD
jgi:hypothetical protein